MNFYNLPIHGAIAFNLTKYSDNRGCFSETFREAWLEEAGITNKFIFDCYSLSKNTGTIRGLHAQKAEVPQAKLVTVLRGSVQDVIVDARVNSPTFGKHCSILISEDEPKVVYIPEGCYHGFITLAPDTVFQYKMNNYHSLQNECGIAFNDPNLDINWGIRTNITISDRDTKHPSWKDSYKFESLV
jgi:dTDP-4-dehydrorhamnose 3,5-epimerase